MECMHCGRGVWEGIVLTRTNPKGEKGIWACDPACGVPFINQDAALIYALETVDNKKPTKT